MRIKGSKRGLTFSFNGENTNFNVGDNYKYIIEPKTKKIFIIEGGNLKVSRKKVGNKIKSLVDLRNKVIKETIKEADFLQISFKKGIIKVESFVKEDSCEKLSSLKSKKIIDITSIIKVRKTLSITIDEMLLKKVSSSNNFEQISLEAYISEQNQKEEAFNYSDKSNKIYLPEIKSDLKKVCKVISLFSGAGMLDFPFAEDKENFDIVYANEFDKEAVATYKNNIGNHIIQGDICNVKTNELPKANLLIGGPPCKPFSNSNRNMENRLDNHKDSKLIMEFIRIANESNFDMFVMENVPQILTACDGKYFDNIKNELSSQYSITSTILKDCDYGGYSKRKRAFIVGSKIGQVAIPKPTHSEQNYRTVEEGLLKVDKTWTNYADITIPKKETVDRMKFVPQGGNWKNIPEEYRTKGKQDNCYRRLKLDEPCCTLVNYRKPPIIHPIGNRTLTVAEASALSGFDERMEFLGSLNSKQQQVGNGVPYALGKVVKSMVQEVFFEFINKQENYFC